MTVTGEPTSNHWHCLYIRNLNKPTAPSQSTIAGLIFLRPAFHVRVSASRKVVPVHFSVTIP